MTARHYIRFGCLVASLSIVVAGCGRQQARPPVETPPVESGRQGGSGQQPQPPPCESSGTAEPLVIEVEKLPADDFMEERIARYARDLEHWQDVETSFAGLLAAADAAGRDECRRQVEDILHRYRQLLEYSGSGGRAAKTGEALPNSPMTLLADDLAFAAGGCATVRQQTSRQLVAALLAPQGPGGTEVGEEERQAVIDAFTNLQRLFPEEAAAENVRLAYADAIARSGDWRRAAAIYNDLANSGADGGSGLQLRKKSADLLLSGGDLAGALRLYESLLKSTDERAAAVGWAQTHADLLRTNPASSPLVSLYRMILGEYLRFDGKNIPGSVAASVSQMQSYYADAPVTGIAIELYGEMRQAALAWEEGARARIRERVEAGDVETARRLAAELAGRSLPPPPPAPATPQIPDGESGGEGEEAMPVAVDPQASEALAAEWDAAVSLFDQRRYDEAISAFSTLLATPYGERAREKTVAAANLAAEEMRRQAADLFLKARRMSDSGAKRELLLESRGVLEAIIGKYPQSEVIDKVRRNMQVIDGELQQSGGAPPLTPPAGVGGTP
ncbi:MAG: hypothetical protein AB1568_01990 [Thermodesulfobacteriota bacterium]